MLYTGQGDDGTTAAYGDGQRLSKSKPIIVALGAVDELNTLIGVYRHYLESYKEPISVNDIAQVIQQQLFNLQAELAGSAQKITNEHVRTLETCISTIEPHIPQIKQFVVPGITLEAGMLDHLRAVTRRVEIDVLKAKQDHPVSGTALQYLNRLSSVWYALARAVAASQNEVEESPRYN